MRRLAALLATALVGACAGKTQTLIGDIPPGVAAADAGADDWDAMAHEPSNEGSDAADAACPAGTFLCPMCPGPGTVCQDHECAGPMCPPVGP